MARYRASIDTQWTPHDVFAYLSDFSTTAEWDPGIASAERVSAGPIGLGSEFRLVARSLGRQVPLTYRIVAYDPPRVVTLVGENATVLSRDRITVQPTPAGAEVTYDADLRLKGPLRVADPLLRLAFKRMGDRALAGLSEVLGSPPHVVDSAA
jgi:carbon monoxide dehydrogenase subunit G